MIRNIIYLFFLVLFSCNESNLNQESGKINADSLMNNVDNITQTKEKVDSKSRSYEFVFKGGDSITVTLWHIDSLKNKMMFRVEADTIKFEGAANLELIEDNGRFYLPESTPRLDEVSNQEYMCDSTFSFQSEKISFVFAMENKTHKRLSFIINNSTIAGLEDNFFTLYKKD